MHKEKYINLLPKSAPLFYQPFWLDITSNKNWDVVIDVQDEKLIAALPFSVKQNKIGTILTQPKLTPFLGPYINLAPNIKYYQKIQQEDELIKKLFSNLPKHYLYEQNWHYNQLSFLPLINKSFEFKPRYTYLISNNTDINALFANMSTNERSLINKGSKELTFDETPIDGLSFWNNLTLRFGAETDVLYDKQMIINLVNEINQNKKGKIITTIRNNVFSGSLFLVEDETTVYNLIGFTNLENKDRFTHTFLIWEGIKYAISKNKNFDFEGSILPTVEPFFRKFGGVRKIYFTVSKKNPTPITLFHEAFFKVVKGVKLIFRN
jgi:hypothetical protein